MTLHHDIQICDFCSLICICNFVSTIFSSILLILQDSVVVQGVKCI